MTILIGQQTLSTPLWCSICHSNEVKLHTHHLSYEPEIVMSLCRPCHVEVHRSKPGDKFYQFRNKQKMPRGWGNSLEAKRAYYQRHKEEIRLYMTTYQRTSRSNNKDKWRTYWKKYYNENREKILYNQKVSNQRHSERRQIYLREYNKKNKEKKRNSNCAYRSKNRERINAYQRIYYKEHPRPPNE